MDVGPVELVLIIVIVAMLFGVGKLPEVFGAVGKGIREFRREMIPESGKSNSATTQSTALQPESTDAIQTSVDPLFSTGDKNESTHS